MQIKEDRYFFIRNGGKSEIIVSDNGDGIKKDQLKNAILRHATSKLNNSTLCEVKTMGFRGEAFIFYSFCFRFFFKL